MQYNIYDLRLKTYTYTKHFTWMTLKDVPEWNQVFDTISILSQNNVKIDDSKCFDQLQNLKRFLNTNKENDDFKK